MINPTLRSEASEIGSSLTVMIPALKLYNVNPHTVFARHGVEIGLAAQPTYRVPVARTSQLWADAARSVGDDAFGLQAGSYAHPTMYHCLGVALWSSGSLRELIECWVQYLPLYSTAVIADISDKGGHYELTARSTTNAMGNPDAGDIAVDAALASLLSICRIHGNSNFSPRSVQLIRPSSSRPRDFENFFNCPVVFSTEKICLCFDRAQMDEPIVQASPILMREMESHCQEYILQMGNQDLINRLRAIILEQLPNGGADQERVAEALYMAQAKLSVLDIAFQLGFSNCSNFTRAFRRWMGKTPREYRAELMSLPFTLAG